MVVLGNHFFERQFQLLHMGGGSEIIGVMYCTNDELFFHSNCEDGVSFLKLFIPTIVGISIG